jgi:hypothetical protein
MNLHEKTMKYAPEYHPRHLPLDDNELVTATEQSYVRYWIYGLFQPRLPSSLATIRLLGLATTHFHFSLIS